MIFKLSGVLVALALFIHSSPALDWKASEGYRSAALPVPATGKAGFMLMPASQTGITFSNRLSDEKAAENQIRLLGSGVALGDVDGDGWCDIYLCRLEGPNVLYRNLGNWKFEDITASAGVACSNQYSTGAVLADVDGDGDLDLLVNSLGGGTRLFLNDGAGRFTEAADSGLLHRFGATSMALADVDGDGDLDLYVTNYRTNTVRSTGLKVLSVNGKRFLRREDRDQYEFTPQGLLLEHGEVDALYLNDGKGHFAPVSWTGGSFLDEDGKPLPRGPRDWGLSVMFRDLTGDGAPEIYICNDFWTPDRFWINDGKGHFRAAPRLALRHTSTFSMGVDFADINRDGYDDFMVLDMLSRDHPRQLRQRAMLGQTFNNVGKIEDRPQMEHNTLFLNQGDGTYAEIAQLSGVQASEWSWGIVFLDVDLDGYEDFLVTTGHGFDTQDSDTEKRISALGPLTAEETASKLLMYPRLNVTKQAFHNRGDLTFEDAGKTWGFNQVGVAHGIALADLDNDGDLDVVVNNLNAPAGIYRNDGTAPRVAVRLKGSAPNTRGIGAKIKILDGPVPQSQEMICGGRYLSGDDAERVFAAGKETNSLTIQVTWRNGTVSTVSGVIPNRLYEIDETGAKPAQNPQSAIRNPQSARPLFQDVTSLLHHTHHEEPFDDFTHQPLLSKKLSQLGPGLSWFDVDGDGRDDLIIGSGRGGELAIFLNHGSNRFDRFDLGNLPGKAMDDQTTVLGWPSGGGNSTILIGTANYETGPNNAVSVQAFERSHGGLNPAENLPSQDFSPGPMAAADVDGDGDLDLFVGGRVIAGRYPEAATSRLYRNDGGKFHLLAEWPKLGLVSGAIFSDLDGDGFPELILACEWGPIRIFRNNHGQFTSWDAPVQFSGTIHQPSSTIHQLTGWWNGVAVGDFDGDGRMDIVASNWGRNSPYQQYLKDDLRLYYGDLAGAGSIDIVEAVYDSAHARLAPWRDLDTLAGQLPWIREKFATSQAYSEASLEQIVGERLKNALELRARWLDTTVFLNRGDHFEVRSLPVETQFSPAFGICVADFDGDGHEDIFLSQNFFAAEERTSRYDAGRGLLLRGDGKGSFKAMSAAESGIEVYGEQRGAAVCDYDGDGRVDLAVTQNGAATRLFHNANATPGLRVSLKGSGANPSGIGTSIRLGDGQQWGPARELHAGGGYWSQDSAIQVMVMPLGAHGISVLWPGGKTSVANVPPSAREIAVLPSGKVEIVR